MKEGDLLLVREANTTLKNDGFGPSWLTSDEQDPGLSRALSNRDGTIMVYFMNKSSVNDEPE